jgi:hypothetical protein
MIPVNYCTSIDSSQKYLVYSIETHIKIYTPTARIPRPLITDKVEASGVLYLA